MGTKSGFLRAPPPVGSSADGSATPRRGAPGPGRKPAGIRGSWVGVGLVLVCHVSPCNVVACVVVRFELSVPTARSQSAVGATQN